MRASKGAASAGILLTASLVLASQTASAQDWISPEKRCPSPYGTDDQRDAANLQTPQSVVAEGDEAISAMGECASEVR